MRARNWYWSNADVLAAPGPEPAARVRGERVVEGAGAAPDGLAADVVARHDVALVGVDDDRAVGEEVEGVRRLGAARRGRRGPARRSSGRGGAPRCRARRTAGCRSRPPRRGSPSAPGSPAAAAPGGARSRSRATRSAVPCRPRARGRSRRTRPRRRGRRTRCRSACRASTSRWRSARPPPNTAPTASVATEPMKTARLARSDAAGGAVRAAVPTPSFPVTSLVAGEAPKDAEAAMPVPLLPRSTASGSPSGEGGSDVRGGICSSILCCRRCRRGRRRSVVPGMKDTVAQPLS